MAADPLNPDGLRATLRELASGPLPVVLLFLLLLASLTLLGQVNQNTERFEQIFYPLLIINLIALLLLITLLLRQLVHLYRQYRDRVAGSRLTVRLLLLFTVLSLVPAALVYTYALQFLGRGIDSWFDLRVEEALDNALAMGRLSLDQRRRTLLRQTQALSEELRSTPQGLLALELSELRQRLGADEITLMGLDGRVDASSSEDITDIVPTLPNTGILRQLRQGHPYAEVEPRDDNGLIIRIAVPVPPNTPSEPPRLLHLMVSVDHRSSAMAASIQDAFTQYRRLLFMREPLKYSFILSLSLVLLLSLLASLWAAVYAARRLAAPITDLAEGTRAMAAGDYGRQLPLPAKDELGMLVRSFNEMSHRIARSRDEAEQSQREVETQRAYLEAVLGHLSSGVLTVDGDGVLRTANPAAALVLGMDLGPCMGKPIVTLEDCQHELHAFIDTLREHLDDTREWRSEVELFVSGRRQVLLCRGSRLPSVEGTGNGQIIVFDDVTALIQAQRDAAWGEVARRLAHEIKNPLTPIQLSAERLRHKILRRIPEEDAGILDRATHTIIQQVETMKEMVKAFSDYAHTPPVVLREVKLAALVREVAELYRGNHELKLRLELERGLPPLEADPGRLRQLLHNLIKNAQEAMERPPLTLQIRLTGNPESQELTLEDDGPGFPDQLAATLFEPYVTTKPKGTGLGLAIVKKIVEEHGGIIRAENHGGGARITLRLPLHH